MLWIWVAGATPLDVEETARSLGAKAADLDVVLDLSAMALEADEADRARLERAILLATALEHAEPPFDEKDRTLCYEVVLGTPESADEAVAAVNKGFLPGAWLIAKLPADLAAAEAPARVPLLKEWLGRRLDEETRAHVAHALGVIEELPADAVPEVVEVVSRMALAAAVAPTSATVSTSSESGSIVDDAKRAALRRYKDERITFTTDSARELRDDYVWVDGESRTMTTFRDRLVWGVSREA